MNGGQQDVGAPLRLQPSMVSFRLLVLAFVRDYFGKHGASPSLGEIANGVIPPTNRTRVKKAVRSLAAEGLLLHSPGPRGLAMPTAPEAALRVLRKLGWRIDGDLQTAFPPDRTQGVTDPPLLPPAELDYLPNPAEGRDGDFTD